MILWRVVIPGVDTPILVIANNAGDALATALIEAGHHFAPPGTTVSRDSGDPELTIPTTFADRIGTTGDAP